MNNVLARWSLSRWPKSRMRARLIPAGWVGLHSTSALRSSLSGSTSFASLETSRRNFGHSIIRHDEARSASPNSSQSPYLQPKSNATDDRPTQPPSDWDENPDLSISAFSELPSANFGVNQHMIINTEFKEALRQILWQFKAPIRYAFAYGSGVFPQTSSKGSSSSASVHPHPSKAVSNVQGHEGKMIDFIFGVSYTEHWHSLNLQQHRDHYSGLGSFGSGVVKRVQDGFGAGVYFNPFVTVNGTLIKYGVVNLDTLCKDLSEWQTLYLAGRLHKPVKILRDDPRVRLANQINLISAVRTALLLLGENFTERDFYTTIASISYLGDPRMALPTENRKKVENIVTHQLTNFRYLYAPLIENLPNISFNDSRCSNSQWQHDSTIDAKLQQDMDPVKRGNMVRRLPKAFRSRLYFRYQSKFGIPGREFNAMMEKTKDEDEQGIKRQQGGDFEQRMGSDEPASLNKEVSEAIRKTIAWPATSQSVKSFFTAGVGKSWRYIKEKQQKYKDGQTKEESRELQQSKKALDAATGPLPAKGDKGKDDEKS